VLQITCAFNARLSIPSHLLDQRSTGFSLRLLTMRYLSVLPFLASLVAASDVLDLNEKTFNTAVNGEDLILVEFFAPWCGHCRQLAPEYEVAATELKERSIKLAKVDCTAQAELCSEHGVQGYPTLKLFEKGVAHDYGGPRKADGIVSFMKKRSLPAVSTVTAENHTEFSKADRVVVIAYLDASDAGNLDIFNTFAAEHRDDYLFGASYDPAVATEVGVSAPSLVLYKDFDEGRNDLTSSFTQEGILDFVGKHSVPLFDEISPSNFATYAESGLPLAYTFIEAADPKREEIIKSLESVAKAHQGSINFVWIDALKFADHAKSLNLGEPKWPAFAIQNIQAQEKFPLDGPVDLATVQAFVQDWADGKIKPSIKSQPIPVVQDEPVFVLVADEFEKVVYGEKNDQDVLIEFYAPWCGHCKRLKPTWDDLAERFAGSKDKLLVAKFDATENDVPPATGIKISGFPTIKFKATGSREFIEYQGDRSIDSLIAFVEENSVHKAKAAELVVKEEATEGDTGATGHDEL